MAGIKQLPIKAVSLNLNSYLIYVCICHWRESLSLSFDVTSTKVCKKLNLKVKITNDLSDTGYSSSDDEGSGCTCDA